MSLKIWRELMEARKYHELLMNLFKGNYDDLDMYEIISEIEILLDKYDQHLIETFNEYICDCGSNAFFKESVLLSGMYSCEFRKMIETLKRKASSLKGYSEVTWHRN